MINLKPNHTGDWHSNDLTTVCPNARVTFWGPDVRGQISSWVGRRREEFLRLQEVPKSPRLMLIGIFMIMMAHQGAVTRRSSDTLLEASACEALAKTSEDVWIPRRN